MTSLLTVEDELILRSRIRRRFAIEHAITENGLSAPEELGPDAALDWRKGEQAAICFASYSLPAIRRIAYDSIDAHWLDGEDMAYDAMNRAYRATLKLAWSNTSMYDFMSEVLGIDPNQYNDDPHTLPADEAPAWESFAVNYGAMGRYPLPLYGRETPRNIHKCIDVIADSIVFSRSLATVAPPDIVKYVISSLGIDRGYPRDTMEIIKHLNIRPNVERARKKAAQSILSSPDLCDQMRVEAESWYMRFGMNPKDIVGEARE